MSVSIGLDISKKKIDFYCDGEYAEIPNDPKAIKQYFEGLDKNCRVVMEATGKYHRKAHKVIEQLGFEVMVVNPYQSKHFAKAMNVLCKTDKVDAKMLSLFADRMEFKATLCASEQAEAMQDLSRHLDDLKQSKQQFGVREKESKGFIKRSLKKTISSLDKEIKETEKALKQLVAMDKELQRKVEVLVSIPGCGESTAISLLSYLRELGQPSKREISALAGLAPVNNDSGTFKGKRRIQGGRADVRTHLYMPILGAATQHNKRLKVFYERLVGHGKPKKVALTACMRKLVVWANAMLKADQLWCENQVNYC